MVDPLLLIKTPLKASQIASGTGPGNANITGLNVNIIRLADVYLMAAECEVELGNLAGCIDPGE